MAEPTSRPWRTDCTDGDGFAYVGSSEALVAIVQHDLIGSPGEAIARANAELIVHAVNAHDALLEALREAEAVLSNEVAASCNLCDGEGGWDENDHMTPVRHREGCAYEHVRAALALAQPPAQEFPCCSRSGAAHPLP